MSTYLDRQIVIKERLAAVDYIRLLSIFPIVYFHIIDLIFYRDSPVPELLYQPHIFIYEFNRHLSFSGFTIVFIYCFLLGFKNRPEEKLNIRKLQILTVGILVLAVAYKLAYESEILFEWDIYHFLILSFTALHFLKHKFGFKLSEVILFGSLACVPFWLLEAQTYIGGVFFGNCDINGSGLWPIFPNLFLVFYGFSLGGFVSKGSKWFSETVSLLLLCIGVAALAYVSIAHFRFTPVGPSFGCYIHRPSLEVWAALVFGLSALFLGASGYSLNSRLQTWSSSKWLAGLQWNKRFGLCYLVQWFYLLVLYANKNSVVANPKVFFLLPVLLILITELSVRVLCVLGDYRAKSS